MATHKLAILVTAIGAAKAAKNLRGVDAAISGIGARSGKGLRTAGTNIGKLGVAAGAVAVGGLAAAAKAAIDWEDAFQGVVKTVDAADLSKAGLTFEGLAESIRKMSREMPNSAIELAGIAEQAGALGIKAGDIEAFTRQVAILASTTNVSADEAATALGQLQNVIGLTGDEFDNFAAALVDLGNKGASTEADILEIGRRAGAAGKLFGISKDQILGWSAAAANLGMNPELAGTALQTVFLKALPQFQKGSKALQLIMGKTAKQIKHDFKEDAGGALQDLIASLGKMSKADRLAAAQRLFGKTSGVTRLILGLADAYDKNLVPSLETSTKAWEDASAAQVEFDKRNQTVKSAFSRLRNNIIDMAVTLGEGFAPALGRAADKLSAFLAVPENRNEVKKLGEDIGKLIDGIDWQSLIDNVKDLMSGFKSASDAAKGVFDVFMSMPADVKGLLIALVGLNKLSGGMVTGIVGELSKGLIKGVLGMTAGVVNIKAGVVNGAGGVGGAGGAGGIAKTVGFGIASLIGGAVITEALGWVQGNVVQPKLEAQAQQNISGTEALIGRGNPTELKNAIDNLSTMPDRLDPLQRALYELNANGVKTHNESLIEAMKAALTSGKGVPGPVAHSAAPGKSDKGEQKLSDIIASTKSVKSQVISSGKLQQIAQMDTKRETAASGDQVASVTRSSAAAGASLVASAVRASRPIITTNVSVSVGVGSVTKQVTKQGRVGKPYGSGEHQAPKDIW